MKKVLFLTGDFTEDYETMVPFQMLTKYMLFALTRKKGIPLKQRFTISKGIKPTAKSQAIISRSTTASTMLSLVTTTGW
jgi:hypothetical protein